MLNISKQLNYVNNNLQKTGKFVILHTDLLDSVINQISGNAFKLYYILRTFSDSNYKAVYPRTKVLADKMGCSIDTISRLLKELVESGLIEIKKGAGNRNVYHFAGGPKVSADLPKQNPQILGPCIRKKVETLSNKNQESISNNNFDVDDYLNWLSKRQKIINRAGLKKWIIANPQELDLTEYNKYLQRKNKLAEQKIKPTKSEFRYPDNAPSDELLQFITQCKLITEGKKIT